jgi:hypothetical protein
MTNLRGVKGFKGWGWAMVSFTVAGCGGDTVEEFVNEGSWCLVQHEDMSVTATVITPGCFSGSCSEPMASQCALTRDGAALTLTSLLRVKHLDKDACTADCRIYQAECSLGELPEGQYELTHGETRRTLTSPFPNGNASNGDNAFFCQPVPLSPQ